MINFNNEYNIWEYFICAEEYNNILKDKYNRIGSFSTLKNYKIPVVSKKIFENGFRPVYPGNKTFAICLTHDIDILYLPLKDLIKQTLYNTIKLDKVLFDNIKQLISKNRSRFVKAIYRILELESKYNAKSSFYFLSLTKGDKDYNYRLEDIKFLTDIILKSGGEIALHGGFNAYNNESSLLKEKDRIEKTLNLKVVGYRNHYLKFETPTTWEILANSGLKYDSTCTYHDRIGYRNGMCYPYKPYNLNTNKFIDILEIPTVIVDFALYDYMRIEKQTALAYCKKTIEEIALLNGAVSLLYHNNELFGIDFYEEILQFCRENNAWLTSSEELYLWWIKNNFCSYYNTKDKLIFNS